MNLAGAQCTGPRILCKGGDGGRDIRGANAYAYADAKWDDFEIGGGAFSDAHPVYGNPAGCETWSRAGQDCGGLSTCTLWALKGKY
jgi:hypothetical protein